MPHLINTNTFCVLYIPNHLLMRFCCFTQIFHYFISDRVPRIKRTNQHMNLRVARFLNTANETNFDYYDKN